MSTKAEELADRVARLLIAADQLFFMKAAAASLTLEIDYLLDMQGYEVDADAARVLRQMCTDLEGLVGSEQLRENRIDHSH